MSKKPKKLTSKKVTSTSRWACIYIYIYVYICVCIYIYTHHIYIYIYIYMAVCLFYCSKLSRRGGGVHRHRRRIYIYIYIYAVSRRGVRRHVRRIFSQLGLPIPGLPPFLIVLLKGALKTLCFKLSFYTAIREWSRSNFHYCFIEGRPQNLTF